MAVILAIANHNSGAGKTVTAANVAAGLAHAAAPWPSTATPGRPDRWLLGGADQDAADLEAIVAGGADPAASSPRRGGGLLTQADLDTQGRLGTQVGREARDARRRLPGRAERWSTPMSGWSTTCRSGARSRGAHAASGEHGRVVATDRFTLRGVIGGGEEPAGRGFI